MIILHSSIEKLVDHSTFFSLINRQVDSNNTILSSRDNESANIILLCSVQQIEGNRYQATLSKIEIYFRLLNLMINNKTSTSNTNNRKS